MYICIQICLFLYMYICIYECMFVCMCIYVYIYIYIYVYICVYACMHACMHVCMCMYIYIYTQMYTRHAHLGACIFLKDTTSYTHKHGLSVSATRSLCAPGTCAAPHGFPSPAQPRAGRRSSGLLRKEPSDEHRLWPFDRSRFSCSQRWQIGCAALHAPRASRSLHFS